MGRPFRHLPGLYGLHDGVSLRRGLRQADRSHARANRTRYTTIRRREMASPFHVQHLYAAGAAAAARANSGLYQKSGLQTLLRSSGFSRCCPRAWRRWRLWLRAVTASEAVPEIDAGAGRKAAARRAAAGLRAARVLSPGQRRHGARAGRGGMRGGRSRRAILLRGPDAARGRGRRGGRVGAADDRRFRAAGVDTVVINAAGCGSNMKEYGYLLRDDPQYAERARRFPRNAWTFPNFSPRLGPRATRHPLPLRVAYQDACHLQHAQGVRTQPRSLLGAVPGLERDGNSRSGDLLRLRGHLQSGAAGNRRGTGRSQSAMIAALDADVVVSGNPGCLLQLTAALTRSGKKIPVVHTIQLIDASLRGDPARILLLRAARQAVARRTERGSRATAKFLSERGISSRPRR